MIRDNHVCGTPDAMCDTECMENAYRPLPSPYMAVQLRFDRESFNALKELLRVHSINNLGRAAMEESAPHRREREAIERLFSQIRGMEYDDGSHG